MRYAASVLVILLMAGVLGGCNGAAVRPDVNANESVRVAGMFGSPPRVTIPARKPARNLVVRTTIRGTGPIIGPGRFALVNMAVYAWTGKKHDLTRTTFVGAAMPQVIPDTAGSSGLFAALAGARVGSRILVVLPPADFGQAGFVLDLFPPPPATVVVMDVVGVFAPIAGKRTFDGGGRLPTVRNPHFYTVVSIPKTAPPPRAVLATLVRGSGPRLASGDIVVAGYDGFIWRTGGQFTFLFPDSYVAGPAVNELPGWKELLGIRAGSRVLLVLPAADAIGTAGTRNKGGLAVLPTDTLVYVMDILDVQSSVSVCASRPRCATS